MQADPEDIVNKGIEFPKCFDIYFKYADEVYFYWNEELVRGKLPEPCAKFVNGLGLTIFEEKTTDWNNFCRKYLQDVQQYNIKICDGFKALIPNELLHSWKESPIPLVHALSQVSLYETALSTNPSEISAPTSESKFSLG